MTEKRGRGRPTAYKREHAEAAAKMAEAGHTDFEIYTALGIGRSTFYAWRVAYPEFRDSIKGVKEVADDRVERSLYERANGYSYEAVKIFMPAGAKEPVYAPYIEHVPPDVTAQIFWLKNRRPNDWRDKHEIDHSGDVAVTTIERRIVSPPDRHG